MSHFKKTIKYLHVYHATNHANNKIIIYANTNRMLKSLQSKISLYECKCKNLISNIYMYIYINSSLHPISLQSTLIKALKYIDEKSTC